MSTLAVETAQFFVVFVAVLLEVAVLCHGIGRAFPERGMWR